MTTHSAPKMYRGTEADRAASVAVPAKGDFLVTDEGNVYIGDGLRSAAQLTSNSHYSSFATGDIWCLAGQTTSTTVTTASTEVAVPFFLPSRVTISQVSLEVTSSAASSTLRVGFRTHNRSTGAPGSLLLDAGTVAGTATGVLAITGLTYIVGPGWFWYTVTAQGGAPTLRAVTDASWMPGAVRLSGSTFSAFPTGTVYGKTQTGVTAGLPSTWTTAGFQTNASPRLLVQSA